MINLKRIVLVNWYTFSKLDIELRGSTAIIGPNGAGKSSLQDAIQVVLTGNNKNLMALNASSDVVSGTRSSGSSSTGRRSVYSYCRGVIMGDTLRPACTTYLALVFERETDGRVWTAGIGLACSEDEPSEQVLGVFIAPDQDLTTADFLHTDDAGQEMPMAFPDVEAALHRSEKQIRIDKKRDLELEITRNPSKFTRKLLVALRAKSGHPADDGRFMRTLRNALRFKEMGSANQFIRDFVLEDDKLPIDTLRESVRTWKDILGKIELLEKQQSEAQKLVAEYEGLVDKLDDQMIFGWAHRAAEFQSASNDVDRFGKALSDCETEITRLKALVEHTSRQIDNTNKGINQLELALLNNETEQQLQLIENVQLPQADQLLGLAVKHRSSFLKLCANAAIKAPMMLPLPGIDSKAATCAAMLKQLKDRIDNADGIEAVEIDRHLQALKTPLMSYIEDLGLAGASLNERISEINLALRELQEQRQIINAGKTMVGAATSRLIETLARSNITATPLAELVEVKDPEWLNAVESLLGPAREALIVKPGDAEPAIRILRQNKSEYVGCQIINTTRSGDFDRDPTPGNLAAVLVTEDRHARAFINRRLDNIECVLTEHELLECNRAVTPDCLYASNGSIEVRQMPRNHILGKGAGQRNLPLIESDIAALSKDQAQVAEKSRHYRTLAQGLQAFIDSIEGQTFEALQQEFDSCEQEMRRLKSRKLTLSDERPHEQHQQLQDLKADLEGLAEQKKEDEDLRAKQYTALGTARSRLELAEDRKANAERNMQDHDISDERTRQRAERELRELLKTMSYEAAASEARRRSDSAARIYNSRLGVVHDRTYEFTREFNLEGFAKDQATEDQLVWIKAQLAEISNNHLIQYKESAAKARIEMENALRSDLLIKLWLRVSNATLQINRLNKMLGTKVFHREKYSFSATQEPAYADILKVAKRVQDNDANVMALFADGAETEAEYAKGVARIRAMLEGGDDVSEIADYRNYLRFELNTTDLDGKKVSSYSQRQMSGSGGERQTPFYLAISCAMAQTCHHDENDRKKMGLGLVMFDEAFNALDGGNVNSCLSLMENFNLQVIASAPTDKLPNFMEHMSTIITVNRVGTYCQVDVEYPTQLGREAFRAANPANLTLDMFREMKAAEAQGVLVDAAN